MPCIRANCNDAVLEGSGAWGFSGGAGVCDKHFIEAKKRATDNGDDKGVPASLLADYARIFILLEHDKPKIQECLRALSAEIGNLEGRTGYLASSGEPGHIKLSAALERYETYCWFPPCEDTFISQLPGERFLSYIKRGLMAKDPGAGPGHGDFTHRIHWHIICRIVTNGFTTPKRAGWNHTPLRLYSYLGEGPAVAAKLWTNLFEVSPGSYRYPDTLNAHVCSGNYGALSVNMGRRYQKRKLERELKADKERSVSEVLRKREVIVYDEKKQIDKREIRERTEKHWDFKDSIEKANHAYALRVRNKYGQNDSVDPVLNRGTGQPKTGYTIGIRISLSEGGFNNDFSDGSGNLTYDARLGAVRL